MGLKADILAHMKKTAAPVSGEQLSRVLGVSRVAVWKHIRHLMALGYAIQATPKGYYLQDEPDTPFPWVFAGREALVHHHVAVDSTMESAMELARNGCPPFTVVVAERQNKGRGRLQRAWESGDGGLYFTMVLRPAIPLAQAPLVNLAAAVDLAETLDVLYGVPVGLKWPNDLLVNGCKLAGILSQMAAEPDRIDFINLGIGINVHNDTRQVQPPAVSLSRLTKARVSRARILDGFWDRMAQRLQSNGLAGAVGQWKEKAETLGRQVIVQTLHEHIRGRAVAVDGSGGLVLETADGRRRTILYGDCFHQQ